MVVNASGWVEVLRSDQRQRVMERRRRMGNERITEDIVRDHFKCDPLFEAITFEEQKSSNNRVSECLSRSSKKGTKNHGYPEFIITIPALPDDIIVIECKANEAFHESRSRDNPVDYARDGVEHYAGFLSKEFNVIGIAVSGTSQTPKVSSFYQKSGGGGTSSFRRR